MISVGNKILVDSSGYPVVLGKVPDIELEVRGTQFPHYRNGATNNSSYRLLFTTSVPNIIYIDFGDGSSIYSESFSATWEKNSLTHPEGIHTYPNSNPKIVKIWFESPASVSGFTTSLCNFYGAFPRSLGFYRLMNMNITSSYFDSFPFDFMGGVWNNLALDSITMETVNSVPDWILKSKITTLNLRNGFNFSSSSTNKLDQLINIPGLTNLIFQNNQLSAIPNNFKNISTLRILSIGSNPIGITQTINDCKQLTSLRFGYDVNYNTGGSINSSFSFGVGIAGMNLTSFVAAIDTVAGVYPTTPITGILQCPSLKNINNISVFRTQARVDAIITNYYDLVVANATPSSSASVTGLLRTVTLNVGQTGTSSSAVRPSGTYQVPTGSNGSPASPMEMIYVLNKNYRWVITVVNPTGDGNQTLIP